MRAEDVDDERTVEGRGVVGADHDVLVPGVDEVRPSLELDEIVGDVVVGRPPSPCRTSCGSAGTRVEQEPIEYAEHRLLIEPSVLQIGVGPRVDFAAMLLEQGAAS